MPQVFLSLPFRRVKLDKVMAFSVPLFFVTLVENSLAFIFPIVVGDTVSSNLMVGLVLAFSSVVSVVLDFVLPIILQGRRWPFQFLSAAVLALLFPVFVAMGRLWGLLGFFFLASVIWGVFYELLMFAQQNFVVDEEPVHSYSRDWGIINIVRSIAGIIGPILGAMLIHTNAWSFASTLLGLELLGITFFFAAFHKFPQHRYERKPGAIEQTVNILKEVKIWEVFIPKILPIILMGIMISFIDATYWTMGGLFGEDLATGWGESLPVVLYTVPLVIGSLLISRWQMFQRKKFFSQLSLLVGGLILLPIALVASDHMVLLFFIMMSSFAFSFCWPLNDAVYCDLQERADKYDQDIVGISKMNNSMAYIIAPIVMGFASDQFGFPLTFTLLGVLCVVAAVVLLLLTPRKLKIPHTDLQQIR